MELVHERRASTILYNLLCAADPSKTWLLPANSCPIVPLTFLKAGRRFEFVDVDEDTLCLERTGTLSRLERDASAYAGVLFIRTYGTRRSFDDLFAEIKRLAPGLLLIDDRCLCLPEFDAACSPDVDVVLYSTGYGKPVDLGSGGFGLLREAVAYRRETLAFDPRSFDRLVDGYKKVLEQGGRYRYSDGDWLDVAAPEPALSAYRERVEQHCGEVAALKTRINAIYETGLPAEICLGEEFRDWRFNIVVPDKHRVLGVIFDGGLFASSHYHDLSGVFADGRGPVAARLHERVVNLFNDAYYSEEKAERTVRILREHLAG